MSRNQLAKPSLVEPLFRLNMRNADELFPGFSEGDFAVIYGSTPVISLTSLLCVRAQLPKQLGGLESNVVFIDAGGATFRLYQIAKLAQIHQLNPKQVLDRIYISRAFTPHQEIFLVMHQLKNAVARYNAKLVIVSDIAGLFLDDIAEEEAQSTFKQLTAYLSNFAKENRIIIIATYLAHQPSKRNLCLKESAYEKANVVLSLEKTKYTKIISLEKHPCLNVGSVELPSEDPKITDFISG